MSNFCFFLRNSGNTIVAAYFIYPNGTALTSDQVEAMLSSPEHYPELRALGLTYIVSTSGFRKFQTQRTTDSAKSFSKNNRQVAEFCLCFICKAVLFYFHRVKIMCQSGSRYQALPSKFINGKYKPYIDLFFSLFYLISS